MCSTFEQNYEIATKNCTHHTTYPCILLAILVGHLMLPLKSRPRWFQCHTVEGGDVFIITRNEVLLTRVEGLNEYPMFFQFPYDVVITQILPGTMWEPLGE